MKYPVTISSTDKLTVSSLVTCLRKRWKFVHRNESHFFFKYRKWLKVFVDLNLPQKITTGNYNFNIMPIVQMSEEAQESCNKYIRKFRTDYTRKCSQIKTMQDIFLRIMMTSDLFISSLKKLPTKKIKSLSPEAVKLLIQPSTTESKNYENDLSISDTSSNYKSDELSEPNFF
jgi:hypothetical protein